MDFNIYIFPPRCICNRLGQSEEEKQMKEQHAHMHTHTHTHTHRKKTVNSGFAFTVQLCGSDTGASWDDGQRAGTVHRLQNHGPWQGIHERQRKGKNPWKNLLFRKLYMVLFFSLFFPIKLGRWIIDLCLPLHLPVSVIIYQFVTCDIPTTLV